MSERTFLDNRHPYYKIYSPFWEFLWKSYSGGPEYTAKEFLIRHPKEKDKEFEDRAQRTQRQNFVRQVVDIINTYLFKSDPAREQGSPAYEKFKINADGRGSTLDGVMQSIAIQMQVYGLVYIMVEKPDFEAANLQQELEAGLPYLYSISPEDVLDVIFDPIQGNIVQALVREQIRNVSDLGEKREDDGFISQWRLWKPDQWELWGLDEQKKPKIIDSGINVIGRVPIVKMSRDKNNDYVSPSQVEDTAGLDKACYNYASLLDEVLCGQTFSSLTLPVDGFPDDWDKQFGLELGVRRSLPYKANDKGSKPEFISPDASQGGLILQRMQDAVNQIYRLNNLIGEVGTEDTSATAGASGVAMAYDFEKLQSMLSREADRIEAADKEIAKLFYLWMNDSTEIDNAFIIYPDKFDVKTLAQDLAEYNLLEQANISDTFNKLNKKYIVGRAMPKLDEATRKKIDSEIDSSPDETDVKARAVAMAAKAGKTLDTPPPKGK